MATPEKSLPLGAGQGRHASSLRSVSKRVQSWLQVGVLALVLSLGSLLLARPALADVPGHMPRVTRGQLQLPVVPAGYLTQDKGWLKLSYPPELSHWATPLVEQAEAFRAEVNSRLGASGLKNVHVRLAKTARDMTLLAPEGAPYPDYAEGVAYSGLGLILLTEQPEHGAEQFDLLTTFRHELAHVALHDALDSHDVPLWFNEGLAVHLSRENAFARTQALWTAAVSSNLLPLSELERRFPRDLVGVPLAYAQSADVVRYLLRTQDQERFRLLIKRVGRGQPFERALYDSYGMELYNLESAWRADVASRFSLWPVLFSGTVLWTFGVVLVTLAWRRKRTRQSQVLERWAREEALEEQRLLARQARLAELAKASVDSAAASRNAEPQASVSPSAAAAAPRQAWASSESASAAQAAAALGAAPRDSQVPKVRHEDGWHTLH
jgi:hypothetical protein